MILAPPPLVMGILNVTPDSFSGDGMMRVDTALSHAEEMIRDGAAILDIGGESSRPGAKPVEAEEEIRRTIPLITAIKKAWPSTPISIDTVKPDVAKAALEAGATILNDISGARADPLMWDLAAKHGAFYVLMHNTAGEAMIDPRLGGAYKAPPCENIVADVRDFFTRMTQKLIAAGVARDKIILDPGLGFGKTVEQNLQLVRGLEKLSPEGLPILVGPSRKNFIGCVLDLPPDDRLEGTAAVVTAAVLHGASAVRVHDVKAMARVVKMAAALRH